MAFDQVNWFAVIAAAVSSFLIGGVWYSPALFGRAWMSANGFTETDLSQRKLTKVFGVSLVCSFLMATNLALFLSDPSTTVAWGATAGFLTGFGWVATGIAIVALFERRSWSYILINAGYLTVALIVMGAILGLWR